MMEDFDFLDDDVEVVDIVEYGIPRRIYHRPNYFEELDEFSFFKRFRLYKNTVMSVLLRLEHDLEYTDDRNNSVSPINQVLCCLRYFSSSGHLMQTADFMHMDVSTASRIVKRVSQAIARLFAAYVKMPEEQDFIREQTKFYAIAQFPRVIGIVDGTHIRIQSPGGENAEVYRNRKSYFSLNVQVVGSADLKFIDVVARWPGSAHDATIFANSRLRGRFEAGQFDNCLLIGDSGYPLKNYLMTPIRNPNTRAQRLYNDALVKTRNSIERQIGLWKRRFPVMAYGLRLNMDVTKAAIVATTVLHNIAREMNEPTPPIPDGIDLNELNYLIETENLDIEAIENVNTNWVQNQIVNTHFGG